MRACSNWALKAARFGVWIKSAKAGSLGYGLLEQTLSMAWGGDTRKRRKWDAMLFHELAR